MNKFKPIPIQPVIITPFKRELVISSHLFEYLRREADKRGISPSETASQLILAHLGLSDEKQLVPLLQSKISRLHQSYKPSTEKPIRISQEELLIVILANALTIIELKKFYATSSTSKMQ